MFCLFVCFLLVIALYCIIYMHVRMYEGWMYVPPYQLIFPSMSTGLVGLDIQSPVY